MLGRPKKVSGTLQQQIAQKKKARSAMNITEKVYLWNNRGGHDKVYGLFRLGRTVIKVWGRRGSTGLRYEPIENAEPQLYTKTLQEKIGKGYDEIQATDPTRTKIIKDINAVLDNFVKEPVAVDPSKQAVQAPAVLKPMSAICVNNTGIEHSFDKGVEYFYIKDNGNGTITVEDALGTERVVLKERFKLK